MNRYFLIFVFILLFPTFVLVAFGNEYIQREWLGLYCSGSRYIDCRHYPPKGVVPLLDAPFDGVPQTFTDGEVLDVQSEGVLSGALTVYDTGSGNVQMKSSRLVFTSSSAWGDIGATSQAIVRDFGVGFFGTINSAVNTYLIGMGWKEDENCNMTAGGGDRWSYDMGSAGAKILETAAADLVEIGDMVALTDYKVAFLLGGYNATGVPYQVGDTVADFKYGVSYWIKGGVYTDWTLAWKDAQQNTTPMYAAIGSASAFYTVDNLYIPPLGVVLDVDTMFAPVYIDVTPDNLVHDIGTGNAVIDTNVTVPAGASTFHIRFRMQDVNNYWNVKILSGTAGDDLSLHKTTATVEGAAVDAADIDWTAGAHDIRIICDGSTYFRVFVDRTLRLEYNGPDTDFATETEIQLVDAFAEFTENRLAAWPRVDAAIATEITDKTSGIY